MKKTYRDMLLKEGIGYEVQPGLSKALCEAGLSLAHDTAREELDCAIRQGRMTAEDGRSLLVLPPVKSVLLAVQETALMVAAGRGVVAARAGKLADDLARHIGYKVAPRRFKVIYADPPWPYSRDYGGEHGHGAAAAHYKTMTIEEIKNLKIDLGWGPRRIRDYADPKGCVLLMWIPAPKVESGFEVMRAWGFPVVTKGFVWFKTNKTNDEPAFKTGAFTRQSDEDCWLGRIGKVTPKSLSVRREIRTPFMAHSRKPREVYERIEALWDGPYLELFSRNRRAGGWCSWGNDPTTRQTGRVLCPK